MRGWLLVASVALALTGCDKGVKIASKPAEVDPYANDDPSAEFDDWYPEETDPPEGTEYSVRLTPLPADLKGLPAKDRGYINHVFSQILALARGNLLAIKALGTPQQESALDAHDDLILETIEGIDGESVPEGLEPFQRDLMRAIELEQDFFVRARASVRGTMEPLFEAEADEDMLREKRLEALNAARRHTLEHQASASKLLSAWSVIQRRYDGRWDKAVRESLYQHLRALQLD